MLSFVRPILTGTLRTENQSASWFGLLSVGSCRVGVEEVMGFPLSDAHSCHPTLALSVPGGAC